MTPIVTAREAMLLRASLWPQVSLYDKQVEIVESTFTNSETYCVAGNRLGKDFVAAFIALSAAIICEAKGKTFRIITTSVAEHHLKVLWGEIGRFIQTSSRPLIRGKNAASSQGATRGPFTLNYQEMRTAREGYAKNPLSYLAGRVSAKGEGMAGHHADFSLVIGDEASGLDDEVYAMCQGWAEHMLWIGNPNNCSNFFRKGVEGGDVPRQKATAK